MNKIFFSLIVALVLLSTTSKGQSKQMDWENPEIFGVNREKPHVNTVPFASQASVLDLKKGQSEYYKTFNGL